jgi:hypothetical protein
MNGAVPPLPHKQRFQEILCSHGDDCEDYYFLGSDAVYCGTSLPTFLLNLLVTIATRMGSAEFSEVFVTIYQTERRHIAEESNFSE